MHHYLFEQLKRSAFYFCSRMILVAGGFSSNAILSERGPTVAGALGLIKSYELFIIGPVTSMQYMVAEKLSVLLSEENNAQIRCANNEPLVIDQGGDANYQTNFNQELTNIAYSGLLLALISGIPSVIFAVFSRYILSSLGAPDDFAVEAYRYFISYSFGLFAVFLFESSQQIALAFSDYFSLNFFSTLNTGIILILLYVFTSTFNMNTEGYGIAASLSGYVTSFFYFMAFKKRKIYRKFNFLSRSLLNFKKIYKNMIYLFKKGLPLSVLDSIEFGVNFFITTWISQSGQNEAVANQITMTYYVFPIILNLSMCQVTCVVIAWNKIKKNTSLLPFALSFIVFSLILNIIYGATIGIFHDAFANILSGENNSSDRNAVNDIFLKFWLINSATSCFNSVMRVCQGALMGMSNTVCPLIINGSANILLMIISAIMKHYGSKSELYYFAQAFCTFLSAVFMYIKMHVTLKHKEKRVVPYDKRISPLLFNKNVKKSCTNLVKRGNRFPKNMSGISSDNSSDEDNDGLGKINIQIESNCYSM